MTASNQRMTRALCSLFVLLALASPATAQSDARVGIGLGVTFYESTGRGIEDAVRLTPVVRGRRKGFGAALGFNWLATEVVPGSKSIPARGDLRVRPIMAGPSYTIVTGRLASSVAVVSGYAFNSIGPIVPSGGPPVSLEVANSPAVAPTVTFAVDLSRRLGLVTQRSYLATRPRVTARADGLEDRSRWKADTVVVQIGIVMGLF